VVVAGSGNDAMFFALNYSILRSRLSTGFIIFHNIFKYTKFRITINYYIVKLLN